MFYSIYSDLDFETSLFKSTKSTSISIPEKPFALAFQGLSKVIDDCLHSRLEGGIFIFSGDAGSGKSSEAQTSIRQWKEGGFEGTGSVIVFLFTLDEMDSYRVGCGLDDGDYACISSDPKHNSYGRGRSGAGEARVLFTTHEQFRRRVAEEGSFNAVELFHYRGRPRTLRLWDEGLNAATAVAISLDSIEALPGYLAKVSGAQEVIDLVRKLWLDKAERVPGFVVTVPEGLLEPARKLAVRLKGHITKDAISALEALSALAGQQAILRQDAGQRLALVGRGKPLPDDIGPIIILDASARIRPSYAHWAAVDANVIPLEPAIADYSDMTLHWCNKGAGKTSLADEVKRAEIVGICARLLNSVREPWLVVHQQEVQPYADRPGYCIKKEIEKELDDVGRVSFLHWGRHLASNDYRHIQNVLIVGDNRYPHPQYEAMYIAATGRLTDLDDDAVAEIAARESAHHIYQAACRSNLRQMVHEKAGKAAVYLIAAKRGGKEDAVKDAFRNCVIKEWTPVAKKPTAKQQKIMQSILALFETGESKVATSRVWQDAGGKDATFLRGIWTNEIIEEFLEGHGIKKRGNSLFKMNEASPPTIH